MGLALVKGVLSLVFGGLRSSWPYREGVRLARGHPEVMKALGEPIEPALLFSGSIHVTGPSGNARFSVPLRGPRGRATLHVVAKKVAGEWGFEQAGVMLGGRQERVDLLPKCLDVEFDMRPNPRAFPAKRGVIADGSTPVVRGLPDPESTENE